jgi:hypothetical protein
VDFVKELNAANAEELGSTAQHPAAPWTRRIPVSNPRYTSIGSEVYQSIIAGKPAAVVRKAGTRKGKS